MLLMYSTEAVTNLDVVTAARIADVTAGIDDVVVGLEDVDTHSTRIFVKALGVLLPKQLFLIS
jgi:hypothetical protein